MASPESVDMQALLDGLSRLHFYIYESICAYVTITAEEEKAMNLGSFGGDYERSRRKEREWRIMMLIYFNNNANSWAALVHTLNSST